MKTAVWVVEFADPFHDPVKWTQSQDLCGDRWDRPAKRVTCLRRLRGILSLPGQWLRYRVRNIETGQTFEPTLSHTLVRRLPRLHDRTTKERLL